MVLPTFGSISISGINSCARFTDGNIGVNTTSPNYNLDINGTLKATTITVGTMLATTSISSVEVNATNSTVTNLYCLNSTLSNLRSTLSSIGTLRTDLGVMTEGLMVKASISTSLTVPNLLVTTSISSGAVNATNSTVTNSVATNLSSGTLNLSTGITSASAQITNSNVTNQTVGTSRITTSLLAIGNSNTVGNIFTTGGNVGINTTTPGSALDIKGNSTWGLTRLAPTTSGGETAVGFFALNDFTASGQATSGNWILGTGINSGGASNFNLFRNTTNILTVATNGNVGIGTTSPSSKLNVSGSTDLFGNLRVGGSSSSTGFNIDLGTSGAVDSYRSGYLYGDGTTIYLTNQQNGALNFGTNNTWNRLVITAAGNVGINTHSPTYRLSVSGDGGFTGNLYVNHGGAGNTPQINVSPNTNTAESSIGFWQNTNNGGALWAIGHNPSGVGNNNFAIYSSTYGGNVLSILNNGNVGIGTNSPGYKLDVNGSFATNTMLIRSTSYSTTLANQVYNGNTWYTAIAPNILQVDATYIVSLSFTCGATPWNIYASFLHMIGYVNDNQALSTSGANVPTTIHANNSNGVDYQIKVRGTYAPNSSSGIQFSVNGTTPSGSWTVKAYRIV
jgi:hypothetical protein